MLNHTSARLIQLINALLVCFFLSVLFIAPSVGAATLDLDNGTIKLKVNLDLGGAITYLSPSTSTVNLINNFDRGRQIQQSYYAGTMLDRRAEGQHATWSPWSWNPIQVGDAFGHTARILESGITDGVIYTKTLPLLWDMNNESAQCLIEQWTRLDRNTVHVRCKLTCQRTDNRWSVVRAAQEIPAIYTNGWLPNLWTYVGGAPWTNAPMTKIVQSGPPWTYWGPTTARRGLLEHWAANLDAKGWGLGVYCEAADLFAGGFAGKPGSGGEFSGNTSYIAPLAYAELEKNSVFEYEYDLILGTLEQIRSFAYQQHALNKQPMHWWFNRNGDFEKWMMTNQVTSATVSGGVLSFQVTGADPYLYSPFNLGFAAEQNRWLHLRMKNQTAGTMAQIFWEDETGSYEEARSNIFTISANDSDFKEYHLNLGAVASWKGTIYHFRVDPTANMTGKIEIDYIVLNDLPTLAQSSAQEWSSYK